jgi:parallel beta-helix repeat protein
MMRPVLLILLCCFAVIFGTVCIHPVRGAEYTVGPAGAEFNRIQSAVAWASSGDTIFVASGNYSEQVKLDKTLSLIGSDTGGGAPMINPEKKGIAIEILADGCTVEGFDIENSGIFSGVRISSQGNTVINNTVTNNAQGILLSSAHNNSLTGNTITGSIRAGIVLENSINNLIEDNRVMKNTLGISLDNLSSSNIIYYNTFSNPQNVLARSAASSWQSEGNFTYTYLGRTVENRLGNYWSDYRGRDLNTDGIGDSPYVISNGVNRKDGTGAGQDVVDNDPLMDPIEYYSHLVPVSARAVSAGLVPVSLTTPGSPAASAGLAAGRFLAWALLVVIAAGVLTGAGLVFLNIRGKKTGSSLVPVPAQEQTPEPAAAPSVPAGTILPVPETLLAEGRDEYPAASGQKFYVPQELENKYTDIRYIGRGGVAHVFSAMRKTDGKLVAVKIPISFDEVTGKCFLNEIAAWETLRHKNIVEVLGVNILPIPYVEMEYVPGSLETVKKPLPVWKAVHIVRGIASALEYAHGHGFIHRDIKPHNILVTDDLVPKITDWGMSKVLATEVKKSSVAGFSLSYAAPEQVSPGEFGRTDARTDIYQLGVVFYELVTGSIPFGGESIVEVGNAIVREAPEPPSAYNPGAAAVEGIILKCLRKRPGERYQSAAELMDALAGYLEEDDG